MMKLPNWIRKIGIRLSTLLVCWWCGHNWTCRASEGLEPLKKDMPAKKDDGEAMVRKFRSYAAMYCRRCGKAYTHAL